MTRALALLFCAACFLLSHPAAAKPRVAVTQIEGDTEGTVRDAVAEALDGGELLLIGSREVNRAVDKLGDIAELTEKDFKKLATELEADAIVSGKLGKVGTTRTLKFRLFVHKKMAQGFTMSFKDPKSEKFRTLLHDKMVTKIGAATGGDEDDKSAKKKTDDEDDAIVAKKTKPGKKAKAGKLDDEEEVKAEAKPGKKAKASKLDDEEEVKAEAKPGKKAKAGIVLDDQEDVRAEAKPGKKAKLADDEEEGKAEARPGKKAKADDSDGAAGDDTAAADKETSEEDGEGAPRKAKKKVASAEDNAGAVDAAAAPRSTPARAANRPAAWVALGPAVLQRRLSYNAKPSANQPRNVTLSPAPGGHLEGELYPLGLSDRRGVLANIALGFEYEREIDVNGPVADMPNLKVPIKQSHYGVGLRYRIAFGSSETSPTLTIGAGFGRRLFSVDSSKLTDATAIQTVKRDTPEIEYTLYDPGFMLRFPVTRMVALAVGGRGLIITDAGAIQRGTSYGRTQLYGAEGTAVLDVVLGQWISLRFSADFVQVGFTFKGGGTLSNGVGGLADRSISGSAAMAVRY